MPTIRVMTFNINGSADEPDGPNIWPRRAPLSVAIIQRQAPDVIGFQEVEPDNLVVYGERLAGYGHVRGNEYDVAPYAAYTSIFWKISRFELLDAGEFWLSRTPDVASNDWGVPYPMGATWVKLREIEGGQALVVLNTHLEDGPEGELSRVQGSKLIVERLRRLQGVTMPALVTGDFNCNPDSQPYAIFREAGFTDVYLSTGNRDGTTSTFHGYEGEGYSAERYSQGRNTFWRVDWILSRDGGARLQPTSCSVIRDGDPPTYPSDHYPVVADLRLIA